MIPALLIAAHVAAGAPQARPADAGPPPAEIISGAEHAIEAGRLEQASLMVARAMTAGASGPQLARVLADLAFARGNYAEALVRYQSLVGKAPNNALLLERAGLAALKLGEADRASPFLIRATALPRASWRAWNARGVLADMNHDWADADFAYDRAARLAPDRVEPVNNRGWSLLLRGKWQDSLPYLQQAANMDPASARIADNLELAKEALAADLPDRRTDESDSDWASRLNDAGVAAAILGDKARATAAFTQALEASGSWYARAANNLEALKRP
jgi:Flp pilus assembly protein TadD